LDFPKRLSSAIDRGAKIAVRLSEFPQEASAFEGHSNFDGVVDIVEAKHPSSVVWFKRLFGINPSRTRNPSRVTAIGSPVFPLARSLRLSSQEDILAATFQITLICKTMQAVAEHRIALPHCAPAARN